VIFRTEPLSGDTRPPWGRLELTRKVWGYHMTKVIKGGTIVTADRTQIYSLPRAGRGASVS